MNDSIGEQSRSGLYLVYSSMKLQQVVLHYRNFIASVSEECDLYKAVVLLSSCTKLTFGCKRFLRVAEI